MRSIRTRITTLSLASVLACIVLLAGMGFWLLARLQAQSSDQLMSLTCQQQATKLNQELLGIEGSVNACAEIAMSSLSSLDDLRDQASFDDRVNELELLIGSIAQNTPGVCTYYLRVTNDPSVEPAGFFYTKQGRDESLTKEPLTQILNYDPSDTEHVGWYYQPAQAHQPLWMAPYYNQNIDVYMFSYVAPLFVRGTFVGVVGMDINLDLVINTIRHIRLYETGFASLVSGQGEVFYHPDVAPGSLLADYAPELGDLVGRLGSSDEASTVATSYRLQGVGHKAVCCALRNDMVLMISASTKEINAPLNVLLGMTAATALLVSVVAVLAVIRLSDRITRPLVQLTEAAGRIAQGDLDVSLPPAGNDEVGALTKSLGVTVDSLRKLVSGMSAKAYRDPLTMVKNKAAYDEDTQQLERRMHEGFADFALCMIDVNDLKVINDRFGHDRGDDYLKACCQLVCRVFDHSPVYRIGGDEFVVLLQNEDYHQRATLLAELCKRMRDSWQDGLPWQRVSFAVGMEACHTDDTSVYEVFHRADQAMYEDKRKMKAQQREGKDAHRVL